METNENKWKQMETSFKIQKKRLKPNEDFNIKISFRKKTSRDEKEKKLELIL